MGLKPFVQLSGTDGNVFALLGLCTRALKNAGQPERAKELVDRITECGSYAEAIALMTEYVEVG